jgi:hypothetical protein
MDEEVVNTNDTPLHCPGMGVALLEVNVIGASAVPCAISTPGVVELLPTLNPTLAANFMTVPG